MGKIDATSEAGKHTGEVNALVYDYDHVYSGGADGVINVRIFQKKIIKTNLSQSQIFFPIH